MSKVSKNISSDSFTSSQPLLTLSWHCLVEGLKYPKEQFLTSTVRPCLHVTYMADQRWVGTAWEPSGSLTQLGSRSGHGVQVGDAGSHRFWLYSPREERRGVGRIKEWSYFLLDRGNRGKHKCRPLSLIKCLSMLMLPTKTFGKI